jgi:hypothetical protein
MSEGMSEASPVEIAEAATTKRGREEIGTVGAWV